MLKLFRVEVASFVAAVIFGVAGALNLIENWEPFIALFSVIGLGCELARRQAKGSLAGRFDLNSERIRHRENLRKIFEEEIYKCRAENLRQDAIVRHVDRMDNYPDVDENKKGISPWFRIALLDTYERGVVLGLQFGGLVECTGGYRYADWVNGEKADVRACLLGNVPYDSIAAVNMDGDLYYHFPHIYCHFDFNGEPYERLWFSEQIDQPHGHPYFKDLGDYKDVVANNPADTLQFA